MGNFLLTIQRGTGPALPCDVFEAGLAFARNKAAAKVASVLRSEKVCCAVFLRENETGSPIAIDPSSGSWIAAIGTWLHSDGYASGSEERLLKRYLQSDEHVLASELEGFFVIIIRDARAANTLVITDVAGSCHAYRRDANGLLAISGSSLILASFGEIELDRTGLQEFLGTGVIYEDRTVHKRIRKLAPASIYRFTGTEKETIERYWIFPRQKEEWSEPHVAAQALWQTLGRAASRVGRLYGKTVCDLTGGYDSRVLVASFLGCKMPVSTVVSGQNGTSDVEISRGLARKVGLAHRRMDRSQELSLTQIDEVVSFTDGEFDCIEYAPVRTIHRTLATDFGLSVNGSFGELARGYWWELLFPHTGAQRPLDFDRITKGRYVVESFPSDIIAKPERLDLAAHMADVIRRCNAAVQMLPNTAQMDNTYLHLRMQRWQGRIASSTNRIWPCVSLFLCRSILDTMVGVPWQVRRRSFLVRRMLRDYAPDLARYPLEHGYPAEPFSLRNAPRFTPVLWSYGRRARSKLLAIASRKGPATNPSVRQRLLSDPEVQHRLDPKRMVLGRFLDTDVLQGLAEASQFGTVSHSLLWSRILSLESALRVIGPN